MKQSNNSVTNNSIERNQHWPKNIWMELGSHVLNDTVPAIVHAINQRMSEKSVAGWLSDKMTFIEKIQPFLQKAYLGNKANEVDSVLISRNNRKETPIYIIPSLLSVINSVEAASFWRTEKISKVGSISTSSRNDRNIVLCTTINMLIPILMIWNQKL